MAFDELPTEHYLLDCFPHYTCIIIRDMVGMVVLLMMIQMDSHVATFDTMVNLQLNIACLIIFAKMFPEDFRYGNINNDFS